MRNSETPRMRNSVVFHTTLTNHLAPTALTTQISGFKNLPKNHHCKVKDVIIICFPAHILENADSQVIGQNTLVQSDFTIFFYHQYL